MRKTYPTSSRSASAVENAEYGDLLREERPRRSKRRTEAPPRYSESASRFDDFDPRDLAEDDEDEAPESSRPRMRRSSSLTKTQWLRKTTAGRLVLGISAVLLLAVLGAGAWMVREFLRTDPRFRMASSSQILVEGNHEVSVEQARAVFGEDIGRNLFFVPITQREQQMEALPWVEHASVERLLPNGIHVRVTERVPVAFAQNGDTVSLIDRHGVLLDMPSGAGAPQYSFPVLTGVGPDVPQSTRAARMNQYEAFLKEVDGHGEKVSSRMSEVDLTEPEDVQALMAEGNTTVSLHFGDEQYFERYKMYQAHLSEWQQQYPKLNKVDLRNAPQVVLGMAEASKDAAKAGSPATAAASAQPAKDATSQPAAASVNPTANPHADAAVVNAKPAVKQATVKQAAVKSKKKNPKLAKRTSPTTAKQLAKAKPSHAGQPAAQASNSAAAKASGSALAQKSQAQTAPPKLVLHTHAATQAATSGGGQP